MSVPVVRLEVGYMKHAILHAFTEYAAQIDVDVKSAVEKFCTPENVKTIIGKAVQDTLKSAIEDEIDKFFRYGAGRKFLAEAVKKKLSAGIHGMDVVWMNRCQSEYIWNILALRELHAGNY